MSFTVCFFVLCFFVCTLTWVALDSQHLLWLLFKTLEIMIRILAVGLEGINFSEMLLVKNVLSFWCHLPPPLASMKGCSLTPLYNCHFIPCFSPHSPSTWLFLWMFDSFPWFHNGQAFAYNINVSEMCRLLLSHISRRPFLSWYPSRSFRPISHTQHHRIHNLRKKTF